jgi:3',5'-cyclic AMP phosphodiesterase CpdA
MTKRFFFALAWLTAALSLGAATPEKLAIRVAFLSDTHVNLRTNESGKLYNAHADRVFAAVNAARVDLVLIAGDLTDGGQPDQMALFKKKVKQLKAPVIFIPGNHDVGHAGSEDKPKTITSEKVTLYDRELGPNWFAREAAGLRIIGVNSCLFNSGLPEETEQWKFLEKELGRPQARPTWLMEHYPLFLKTPDEPANGVWNAHPVARERMLALIKQGGVQVVLSGHLHRPITNRLDGVLYLSNTATAYGLPRGKTQAGWMLLTLPRQGEPQVEFQSVE